MINLLSVSSVSATLEIENECPYYSGCDYEVYLNGKLEGKYKTNIISLFSLEPDTDYSVSLKDGNGSLEYKFHTVRESFAFDVHDFGAKGDGVHDDTLAIQTAITACLPQGRVYFTEGTYLSGPIFPKSDMTLELREGAVLLGLADCSRYSRLPGIITNPRGEELILGPFDEDIKAVSCASLLSVMNVKNLTITGKGVIDGAASKENWWRRPFGFEGARRPRLCTLCKCDNVTLEGLTVQNSPNWTIHPFFCTNSKFLSLRIINPPDSPNTDGLNPEFCDNVLIAGIHFSVGDDCIAIKAGRIEMGERGYGPTKNIYVRNNLMEFGHGAVVVGSEVGGGIRDVTISKCVFIGTDRGLRVKSRRGRGERSIIDNIRMENVLMEGVWTPFVINMFYHCGPDGHDDYVQNKNPLPVDSRTPTVGTIYIENVTCHNAMTAAGFMYGLPERKIRYVSMKNIEIDMDKEGKIGMPAMMDDIDEVKQAGFTLVNIEKIELQNVRIKGHKGESIIMTGVNELIHEE